MLGRFIQLCIWCWYGCIQVVLVASLYKNWRCTLSWTWRLLLISHCWIKDLIPTYLMLALLPRHDSLCGHLQLKNALCFPRLYCFARCIQTIRTWRIFACHLALCSYWWTWLCWSGFYCVHRHRWLGVQIHLLTKCSNNYFTWGLSSVVCNREDCLFPYPLLPWIGGLHFLICLPVLPFFAVSFWWVLTRPIMPALFALFLVLVLLDGGAVSILLCDRVLRAGALALTVGLKVARLLRFLKFLLIDFCVEVLPAPSGAVGPPLELVELLASWFLFGSGRCCRRPTT